MTVCDEVLEDLHVGDKRDRLDDVLLGNLDQVAGSAAASPGHAKTVVFLVVGEVVLAVAVGLLQEDAVIEESIIWQNNRLKPRANLKNCILADDNCYNANGICEERCWGTM